MIYAQIKDGIVQNCILVDEETPLDLFAKGFDYFVRIDDLKEMPGIGFKYNGEEFAPPKEEK